jgi:hypothetical protein
MVDQLPENEVNMKEPYPNFFTTLHTLMLGQIEYTRLRTTLIKIAIWIVIIYIAITILICILSILLQLFGMGILAGILQKVFQLVPKGSGY